MLVVRRILAPCAGLIRAIPARLFFPQDQRGSGRFDGVGDRRFITSRYRAEASGLSALCKSISTRDFSWDGDDKTIIIYITAAQWGNTSFFAHAGWQAPNCTDFGKGWTTRLKQCGNLLEFTATMTSITTAFGGVLTARGPAEGFMWIGMLENATNSFQQYTSLLKHAHIPKKKNTNINA